MSEVLQVRLMRSVHNFIMNTSALTMDFRLYTAYQLSSCCKSQFFACYDVLRKTFEKPRLWRCFFVGMCFRIRILSSTLWSMFAENRALHRFAIWFLLESVGQSWPSHRVAAMWPRSCDPQLLLGPMRIRTSHGHNDRWTRVLQGTMFVWMCLLLNFNIHVS